MSGDLLLLLTPLRQALERIERKARPLLANTDLRQVVLLLGAYSAIRLAEAYGLWRDRAWAEWLAAVSGAVYLPLEISHLLHSTTWINAGVLALNLAVVAYMVVRLRRRRAHAPIVSDS